MTESASDLMPGAMLGGRYLLLEELGRGGMGIVFKARQELLGRTVAIKVISERAQRESSTYARFEREAKVASALNHPNIVTIYDFGFTEQQFPYLVMEYIDGPSMGSMLDDEPSGLNPYQVLVWFIAILEALAYAHAKGVVHRDLKPDNIMLAQDETGRVRVKVVDFGLAKVFYDDRPPEHNLTTVGAIMGTPVFMSPEQCLGKNLDPRSDIYSLACVLFTTLTGQLPLQGETLQETLVLQVTGAPLTLAEALPDTHFPEALQTTISKALKKSPEDRHQTCDELRQELIDVLQSLAAADDMKVQGFSRLAAVHHDAGGATFASIQRKAETGDVDAQNILAEFYEFGGPVQIDFGKARHWYEKAAIAGHAMAQYHLGCFLEKEDAAEEALKWYKAAADNRITMAKAALARCLLIGQGTEPDIELGFKWLQEAIAENENSPSVQYLMACCLSEGWQVEKNPQAAFQWWEKSARAGYPASQWNLGICYEYGDGTVKDLTAALHWYEKAAAQGIVAADEKVKELAQNAPPLASKQSGESGEDFSPADDRTVVVTPKSSATSAGTANNNAAASAKEERDYGSDYDAVYHAVIELKEAGDLTEAFNHLKHAALQGDHPEASREYGRWVELGLGDLARNMPRALKWYSSAHLRGVWQAITDVRRAATICVKEGTVDDELFEWLETEARPTGKPAPAAMLALGILYQGPVRGRKRDLAKALQWYCQSYKNGLTEALDDVARCVEVCLEEEAVDEALIQWLEEEAKGGVPAPQAVIARAIIWQSENNPRGQNYAEALKWYRKAAKLDAAEGLFFTARFLVLKNLTAQECARVGNWFLPSEEGLVAWSRNTGNEEKVAAEKSEALKLLEAAGNDGYCPAIRFLSCLYTRGIGASEGKEKGISLLTKAAELDDARAQALLGAALIEGIACQPDAQTGFHWLEKAASAEDPFAQWNLALCLLEGSGSGVGLERANSLLAKAAQTHFTQDKEWSEDGFASRFARLLAGIKELAKQGNADAQFWLGVCLEHGVGVERNREESAENYLLAAEQGHEQAKSAFDRTPQKIQDLVKKRITSHLLQPRS